MRLDALQGWGAQGSGVNAFLPTVSTKHVAACARLKLWILELFQKSAARFRTWPEMNTFPVVPRLTTDSSTLSFGESYFRI